LPDLIKTEVLCGSGNYRDGMSVAPPILSFSRRTWMTLEPIHAVVYFSPLAAPAYEAIGLVGREGYFASRTAPMGAMSAEVVQAVFYNFSPDVVRGAIPSAWTKASVQTILDTRHTIVRETLAKFASDHVHSADTQIAAGLAKELALSATERLDGRPLFSAHAALPWPTDDEPAMVLWHAQTLLREFRGDGHINLLAAEGLSGLDAHITHIATGQMPVDMMRGTRAWSEDVYQSAVDSLVARGLVQRGDAGVLLLTDSGLAQRQRIEDRTDELAAGPYEKLGEEGCATLRRTARPLSAALVDAGLSPLRRLPPQED
jgi:hypothetical protein